LQLDFLVVAGDPLAATVARQPLAEAAPKPQRTLTGKLATAEPLEDTLPKLLHIHPKLSGVVCSAAAAAKWKGRDSNAANPRRWKAASD